MHWNNVSKGRFIDWRSDPLASRIDPYWVMADGTDYADYGFPAAPSELPVLIELETGWTADRLRTEANGLLSIAPIYSRSRFCTALVSRSFLSGLNALPALKGSVRRIELGLPVNASAAPPVRIAGAPPQSTTEVLMAVIDDGCAFAHRSVRSATGGTLVLSLWDQETSVPAFSGDKPMGAVPVMLGYGREVIRAELEDLMSEASIAGGPLDEDHCYELAGYPELRRRTTHGAHMLDLLCGPVPLAARVTQRRDGSFPDWHVSASEKVTGADIVFVQFPRASTADSSGGWLCVHVLDALKYIQSCAGPNTKRIVVSLSYGSQVGPHDGSSTLERAIADLCADDGRMRVVLPAGNSFGRQAHAEVNIAEKRCETLTWRLPPDSEEPSFAELWLPKGSNIRVRLVPPGTQPDLEGWTDQARCKVLDDRGAPIAAVCNLAQSACGEDSAMVLLQIGPTTSRSKSVGCAPHGDWKIEIENLGLRPISPVSAYIARNDPDMGARRRGRGSKFVDPLYDPDRMLRRAVDDNSKSVVRRRGTMNWTFDVGVRGPIYVIAGYVLKPEPASEMLAGHARYSSAGPARKAASGSTVAGPVASMPTDESPVLLGVRAAGTRSGSRVRLIGTSTAAPQFARLVAATGDPQGKPGPSYPAPGPAQPDDPALFGERGKQDTPALVPL